MSLLFKCARCGILEEADWLHGGMCWDCAFPPDTDEPRPTVRAYVDRDCVACGHPVFGGELCSRCDDTAHDPDRVVR